MINFEENQNMKQNLIEVARLGAEKRFLGAIHRLTLIKTGSEFGVPKAISTELI
jgi:hypothetical protein